MAEAYENHPKFLPGTGTDSAGVRDAPGGTTFFFYFATKVRRGGSSVLQKPQNVEAGWDKERPPLSHLYPPESEVASPRLRDLVRTPAPPSKRTHCRPHPLGEQVL